VIEHRDDYLSMRLPSGAVAVFVAPDRVAIAVDPAKAYALEDRTPFRYQVPRTPMTSYVVVPAEGVAGHFNEVLDLALESLDWRATPRDADWCARCGVGCRAPRDACPRCWVEVDDHGRCLCQATATEAMAS
jgi:hypothetical protein